MLVQSQFIQVFKASSLPLCNPPHTAPGLLWISGRSGRGNTMMKGGRKAHYLLSSFVALWEVFKKVVTGPA
jgi:hypothetical protein